MPYLICCLKECKTKLQPKKCNSIRQPLFWPQFQKYFGDTWVDYAVDAVICSKHFTMIKRANGAIMIGTGKRVRSNIHTDISETELRCKRTRGKLYVLDEPIPESSPNLHEQQDIVDDLQALDHNREKLDDLIESLAVSNLNGQKSKALLEDLQVSDDNMQGSEDIFEDLDDSNHNEKDVFENLEESEIIVDDFGAFENLEDEILNEDYGIEDEDVHQTNLTNSEDASNSEFVIVESQAFSITFESQTLSNTASQASTTSIRRLVTIPSIPSTQKACFLCKNKDGRKAIPISAIKQVWDEKHIMIPYANRCCSIHIFNGRFNLESLNNINATKMGVLMNDTEIADWIKDMTAKDTIKYKKKVRFDFSKPEDLTEEEVKTLTGLGKEEFSILYGYIHSSLRDSPNRHPKNALALFLCLLRLNVSQPMLGIMFGIPNVQIVSDTINVVSKALEKCFVNNFFGFGHMSREEAIAKHSRKIFKILFEMDDDAIATTFDGTYLYHDKPGDFEVQKKTWSGQKKRNLVKPMMVNLESGYVIDAPGPYYSNGANNDAGILKSTMIEGSEFWNFMQPGKDHIILDRGFRDIVRELKHKKFKIHMPALKAKTKDQFSTTQGNESRKCTLVRWLVEAVNGRLKLKFKFFSDVIPGSYLPKLTRFFRIAMAIINCFCPPLIEETERHQQIALDALDRCEIENHVQKRVTHERLDRNTTHWNRAAPEVIVNFPRLSVLDLEKLTLGVYQLSLAKEYTKKHLNDNSEFEIEVNDEIPGIVRAKLSSRFKSAKRHQLWIEYDSNLQDHHKITGHYCTCWQGARTVGMCAHLTCVLWYMGYKRHEPANPNQRRSRILDFLDAGEIINAATASGSNNASMDGSNSQDLDVELEGSDEDELSPEFIRTLRNRVIPC